jgi:hypothetical protein
MFLKEYNVFEGISKARTGALSCNLNVCHKPMSPLSHGICLQRREKLLLLPTPSNSLPSEYRLLERFAPCVAFSWSLNLYTSPLISLLGSYR